MRKLSIGLRLTIWYLAIFAAGQAAFGTGMWLVLRQHMIGLVDDELQDQMEDLRFFLDSQKPAATVAKFQEEVQESYSQEHAGEYLAVVTATGDSIYLSDFLAKNVGSRAFTRSCAGSSYDNELVRGKPLRVLRSCIQTHGITFVVSMGTPTKAVWVTLDAFRTYLLWIAPLMLLVSGTGGHWLSHRALAPVTALTRTARNISGQNLSSRLEALNTGDELQELCETLNSMLNRIESAFERITQFTADASHELRTPLSLMRTEAEIALRRSRDLGTYRGALQNILKEIERTCGLVEDLLALARADSGREVLHLKAFDLKEWLTDSITEWRTLASSVGARLSVSIPDRGPLWVMGDNSALGRVLNILLDNAFKYARGPAQIEVTLQKGGPVAIVSVGDNGIGIAAEEQHRIFERFYRIDKARSRARGGSGLGLAIARWIVERHGGKISVTSVENQGSRFSVELPVLSLRPEEAPSGRESLKS